VRRDVTFASQGVDCAGWLFVPDELAEGQQAPAIVMANAFSATKEIYLSNHAERFAAAGFVVLAFDYRTFGDSAGEPRCQVFPHEQVDDLRNAISWLGTQPEVDATKIGAWGVSVGGGHVMFLSAFDKRIKAVVAMIPAINQWENFLTAMPKDAFFGFLGMLTADRQARYTSGQVNYMQLVAPPGEMGMMPNEAYEFYTKAQQTVAPKWENRVTMESLEKFAEYDPTGPIHLVSPTPLLMIVAEQDQIIPATLAQAAYERAGEPKELLMLACQHTDVYNVEPWLSQSADAATNWFTTHLKETT
jgi:fermentation-respiration switch protein FrsA (DUF1100 family)